MSVYDLYKPLRNQLREQALAPSLRVVWAWVNHLQFDTEIPSDIEVLPEVRMRPRGPAKGIFEWELAALAKELIINAPLIAPTDMRKWHNFSNGINGLKNIGNDISMLYASLFRENIFIEMYRIAHHQFGWQRTVKMQAEAARYYKIFSEPAVDAILLGKLGLRTFSLYTIGLAFGGAFLQDFELVAPINLDLGRTTPADVEIFLRNYSKNLDEMRELCQASQSFDENYVYSFNPLVKYPIVSHVSGGRATFFAPVPRYLLRRFTVGIYYDVLGAPGFDVAFGKSYQAYVGEVIQAAAQSGTLSIQPEAEYFVGRDRKDSVDWITSDSTGELFVECKTKRLRQEAKLALADLAPLRAELSKLTEFVIQIYKTLTHALEGRYTHWKKSDRPVFPLIVTLEEWYVFGHKLDAEIDSRVRAAFGENGLDETLLTKCPYTLCSVEEFERFMPLVAAKGVKAVMDEKVTPKRRLWLLHSALMEAFPEEYRATRVGVFPEALNGVTGE